MSLLCSVRHIFTTYTRIDSSIQLLVNKKFFHQSSFKLIKSFFISSASIYATLFVKVGGRVRGGKSGWRSPRLLPWIFLSLSEEKSGVGGVWGKRPASTEAQFILVDMKMHVT